MTQVFIIIDATKAELCYFPNSVIDKVVQSFKTNIYDRVEEKRYIATLEVDELTKVFKKIGITWLKSDNVGSLSLIEANKYLASIINNASLPFLHNNTSVHQSRRNSIRISKQLDMVKVELPMSLYSFNILNELKKSYSLDSYAWNFIGEKNIAKLFETCKDNKIGIIQEINNVDVVLNPEEWKLGVWK